MFLCKDCTHPEYKDYHSFASRSKGPCENCHYTAICIDIPPYATDKRIDPNWEENVAITLKQLELEKSRPKHESKDSYHRR